MACELKHCRTALVHTSKPFSQVTLRGGKNRKIIRRQNLKAQNNLMLYN